MEDEIKTVDASSDVANKTLAEEVKPKRKYTRRKNTESADSAKTEEPKAEKAEEASATEEVKVEEAQPEETQTAVSTETAAEEVSSDVIEEPDISDVTAAEVKAEEAPVVEETRIEEPKQQAKVEVTDASGQIKAQVTIDWDKAVNKFFVADKQISIFRAPNSFAKGKPFIGRLQVVQNTSDAFIKVRYVRSGLGATYGYIKKSQFVQKGCKIS